MWLKGLLGELLRRTIDVLINCDRQSALHLMQNPMYHERSKHIDIKMHFIKDTITSGKVEVTKVDSEENLADALTKVMSKERFEYCLMLLQLRISFNARMLNDEVEDPTQRSLDEVMN